MPELAKSGDKQFDSLLEDYFASNPIYSEFGETITLKNMIRLREGGWCGAVAEDFAGWLKRHGVKATVVDTDRAGRSWYPDRPKSDSGDSHVAVKVTLPVGRFRVDWCAGQFGYREVPLIRPL